MCVNKSGYYKWKKRQNNPNRYEQVRRELTKLIIEEHKKHPSYGYHRLSIEILKIQDGLYPITLCINAVNLPE